MDSLINISKYKKQVNQLKVGDIYQIINADYRISVRKIDANGNCFYLSALEQLALESTKENVQVLRARIVGHAKCFTPVEIMKGNNNLIDEDKVLGSKNRIDHEKTFNNYIKRVGNDAEFAGNVEVRAFSELYSTNVQIFELRDSNLYLIDHTNEKAFQKTAYFFYDEIGNHFDSVVEIFNQETNEKIYDLLNNDLKSLHEEKKSLLRKASQLTPSKRDVKKRKNDPEEMEFLEEQPVGVASANRLINLNYNSLTRDDLDEFVRKDLIRKFAITLDDKDSFENFKKQSILEYSEFEIAINDQFQIMAKKCPGDGNCFYHSLLGDEDVLEQMKLNHPRSPTQRHLRKMLVNYLRSKTVDELNQSYSFLLENNQTWDGYCAEMLNKDQIVWGSNYEAEVFAEIFQRPIQIFYLQTDSIQKINPTGSSARPIRLLHSGNHFDAVKIVAEYPRQYGMLRSIPSEDSLVNQFQNLSSPSKSKCNAQRQSIEDVEIEVVFSEDSETSSEINDDEDYDEEYYDDDEHDDDEEYYDDDEHDDDEEYYDDDEEYCDDDEKLLDTNLKLDLTSAEFLKQFCEIPLVMRSREQDFIVSKTEEITDEEKQFFGIWMRAELENIKNFDCKFNFDEKTQKLIDEMDRRIKTIERTNKIPKYYTYAIQTHDKDSNETKINFGKGSTIRTPHKILTASLLESKIEDLRCIKDKTSRKISQAIRSNHEIKMIILEKKLPEDRSLAYETLRLEWLFETVEEENNMNTQETSYDLNKLNMKRSELDQIRDALIRKYQRLAKITLPLDIAKYQKTAKEIQINGQDEQQIFNKLRKLAYFNSASEVDEEVINLIDQITTFAQENNLVVKSNAIHSFVNGNLKKNAEIGQIKRCVKMFNRQKLGPCKSRPNFPPEITEFILKEMKKRLNSIELVKFKDKDYEKLRDDIEQQYQTILTKSQIHGILNSNKIKSQLLDTEAIKPICLEDMKTNNYRCLWEFATGLGVDIKSYKEIENYFRSSRFNEPELIDLFNNLSVLLSNVIDYQSISLSYDQFKDCEFSFNRLINSIKKQVNKETVSFILLDRYFETKVKRTDAIKADLVITINKKKYRLSSIICKLDDGKHSLFISDDDGSQLIWSRTNGNKVPYISPAAFGEVSKRNGIIYTYTLMDSGYDITKRKNAILNRIKTFDKPKSKEYKCKECGKQYCDSYFLEQHKRDQHSEDKPEFTCDICDKKFMRKSGLNRHKRGQHSEDKPEFPCDICGKKFNRNDTLTAHKKEQHSEDKPEFTCYICRQKFTRKSGLTAHEKLKHSDDIPKHICDICGKKFALKGGLARHKKERHSEDTPEHICDICGKKFNRNDTLTAHKREQHSEDKPEFTCDICDQKFMRKSGLKAHKREQHSENKPEFTCDICDKKFMRKSGLTRHQRDQHSEDKPEFPCDICGKKFKRKDNLKVHKKNAHP